MTGHTYKKISFSFQPRLLIDRQVEQNSTSKALISNKRKVMMSINFSSSIKPWKKKCIGKSGNKVAEKGFHQTLISDFFPAKHNGSGKY